MQKEFFVNNYDDRLLHQANCEVEPDSVAASTPDAVYRAMKLENCASLHPSKAQESSSASATSIADLSAAGYRQRVLPADSRSSQSNSPSLFISQSFQQHLTPGGGGEGGRRSAAGMFDAQSLSSSDTLDTKTNDDSGLSIDHLPAATPSQMPHRFSFGGGPHGNGNEEGPLDAAFVQLCKANSGSNYAQQGGATAGVVVSRMQSSFIDKLLDAHQQQQQQLLQQQQMQQHHPQPHNRVTVSVSSCYGGSSSCESSQHQQMTSSFPGSDTDSVCTENTTGASVSLLLRDEHDPQQQQQQLHHHHHALGSSNNVSSVGAPPPPPPPPCYDSPHNIITPVPVSMAFSDELLQHHHPPQHYPPSTGQPPHQNSQKHVKPNSSPQTYSSTMSLASQSNGSLLNRSLKLPPHHHPQAPLQHHPQQQQPIRMHLQEQPAMRELLDSLVERHGRGDEYDSTHRLIDSLQEMSLSGQLRTGSVANAPSSHPPPGRTGVLGDLGNTLTVKLTSIPNHASLPSGEERGGGRAEGANSNLHSTSHPTVSATSNAKLHSQSHTVDPDFFSSSASAIVHNVSSELVQQPIGIGMCAECGGMIDTVESACQAMGKLYHVNCFTCCSCNRTLRGKTFYKDRDKVYCEEDYSYSGFQRTVDKCTECGHMITDSILQALGRNYHPSCFRCCVCLRCLDGIPFTLDKNHAIYCIKDYHYCFAPKCYVCREPIIPQDGSDEVMRIVAMEKDFHIECFHCEDCQASLSDNKSGFGCYPLKDANGFYHLLCQNCHLNRICSPPSRRSKNRHHQHNSQQHHPHPLPPPTPPFHLNNKFNEYDRRLNTHEYVVSSNSPVSAKDNSSRFVRSQPNLNKSSPSHAGNYHYNSDAISPSETNTQFLSASYSVNPTSYPHSGRDPMSVQNPGQTSLSMNCRRSKLNNLFRSSYQQSHNQQPVYLSSPPLPSSSASSLHQCPSSKLPLSRQSSNNSASIHQRNSPAAIYQKPYSLSLSDKANDITKHQEYYQFLQQQQQQAAVNDRTCITPTNFMSHDKLDNALYNANSNSKLLINSLGDHPNAHLSGQSQVSSPPTTPTSSSLSHSTPSQSIRHNIVGQTYQRNYSLNKQETSKFINNKFRN